MTEILLWEHLADMQIRLLLKYGDKVKFYFSNLYDNTKVTTDVDVLDREIDAAIAPFMQDPKTEHIVISYKLDEDGNVEVLINGKQVCIIESLNR